MTTELAQNLSKYSHKFYGTWSVEEVLCLTTLIAVKQLPTNSIVNDARAYWKSLGEDCSICPFEKRCVASIINE